MEVGPIWMSRVETDEMCQGRSTPIISYYFHILGDGHQPNSRGLYTHYKDSY